MTRTRVILSSYLGVLLFAALIFLSAWKLLYWQALLYLGVALVGTTLNHLLVGRDSDLTVERASRAREGEDWDKRILGAFFLVNVATFAVAGLDSGRFGWSGPLPLAVAVSGVLLMLVGQVLFAIAKRSNRFFSSTVRIQTERGHRVCEAGPYRYLRHPGYSGMLLSLLAFPLVLEAYWAFVPASLGAVLLIVRTLLEDRFLKEHLPGYVDYATRTRWRLIPRVF